MQARLTLALALSSLFLAACSSSSNSPRAVETPPANNNNGTPVNGVLTACFDPGNSLAVGQPCRSAVPLPNNLLLSGTTDLTLNPPVVNPANFSDPLVAVSSLDGWSTVAPGTTSFNAKPNPASIVAGQSVRVFEVTLNQPGGVVTGVTRELGATEFVATLQPSDASGRTLAIVPTVPLKQLTSYLVVITDGVRDAAGNDATPDQTYFLTKRPTPLCVNGVSTEPLLPNASACGLEPLRVLTNSQVNAAVARGIARDDVVVSWVFTTQSITPVLQAVRSRVQPGANALVRTGLTTAVVGTAPIAEIFIGRLELPYYLVPPSAANPTGPLTGFWRAAPGAYVPPFNALGLSPTSTNITFANPFPVENAKVTVPVLMTIPNRESGRTKPAAGWPVVIYNHGITRNRTDMLAVASTLASQGFAVVAIDQPLHGLPATSPFYIENTPFGAVANERTFDVDYVNNATGAPGPDGVADGSGTHTINLSSLLTSRDNLRQAVADLFVLTATIPTMDSDGDGAPDFDGSKIEFVGQSLGSIVGVPFLALEPNVRVGMLSVPGGGIARMLEASPTFGPRIRAGLAASGGLQPNTPDFDRFFGAAQQVIDPADPINYGFASIQNAILLHEVIGDQVIPNQVAGAPLSGTEPLIRILGLAPLTESVQEPNGVRRAARFIVGDHGSLLSAAASIAATNEMQRQMASFIASSGTAVLVQDPSVLRTQ